MKKTALMASVLALALLLSSCKQNTESFPPEASIQITEAPTTSETKPPYETTAIAITSAPETSAEPEERVLSEYDINKISYTPFEEVSGMEFLSEEQQKAFWLATFVYTCFNLNASEFWRMSEIDSSEAVEGTNFYLTGFTYDSVISAFKTVLSENILNELITQNCADVDGEFAFGEGARGANVFFLDKLDFEQVELTDTSAKFNANALYGDPDDSTVTSTEVYHFEMSLVDGNWVLSLFEFWK